MCPRMQGFAGSGCDVVAGGRCDGGTVVVSALVLAPLGVEGEQCVGGDAGGGAAGQGGKPPIAVAECGDPNRAGREEFASLKRFGDGDQKAEDAAWLGTYRSRSSTPILLR